MEGARKELSALSLSRTGGIRAPAQVLRNSLPRAMGQPHRGRWLLDEVPRDEWHVHLAARDHMALNAQLIPTGERKPVEFADPLSLSTGPLDDVFGNLIRDPDGLARFHVEGGSERITVTYGPKYTI